MMSEIGPTRWGATWNNTIARDAFVGLAVSLFALALGIGLCVELGFGFWSSLTVALAAYVVLMSLHVVLRRAGQLSKALVDDAKPQHDSAQLAHEPLSQAAYNSVAARVGPLQVDAKQSSTAATHTPPINAALPLDWSSLWRERAETSDRSKPDEAGVNSLHAQTQQQNFDRLQSLVKQLAADTAGPKATTPDPDRWVAQIHDATGRRDSERRPAVPSLPSTPFYPEHVAPAVSRGESVSRGYDMAQPDMPAVVDLRIAEAVAAERVDVYLEPIQTLADRKPQHFEISVRFRDAAGVEIAGDDLARVARASGLGASVDAVKLPRVARVAQRVQGRGRPADVLTTLFGDSLADQGFLEQFAIEFAADVPARIVLSFAQADVRAFGRVHWETLATMAELGLKFAVEDVTDLDMDFEGLKACNFKFVKLDAKVFLEGLPAAGGSIPAADLCRHFSALGIALVVGSIKDEWLLARIHGFGALLGQGPLFGGPRPVRQDVLTSVKAA